jgi:hypothetical protein
MRPTIPQTHGANGFRNDSRRREAVGVVTTGGDSCAARSDGRHGEVPAMSNRLRAEFIENSFMESAVFIGTFAEAVSAFADDGNDHSLLYPLSAAM